MKTVLLVSGDEKSRDYLIHIFGEAYTILETSTAEDAIA